MCSNCLCRLSPGLLLVRRSVGLGRNDLESAVKEINTTANSQQFTMVTNVAIPENNWDMTNRCTRAIILWGAMIFNGVWVGHRPDSSFEKGENQNLLLALGFQFTTRPVCARLMNIDLLNWFNGLSRLFTTTLNALSRFPPTWNCCIWNRSSCALARATRDNLTK